MVNNEVNLNLITLTSMMFLKIISELTALIFWIQTIKNVRKAKPKLQDNYCILTGEN